MSDDKPTPHTVTNIGVAMFTVADQDAALAFYTEKLGFEVRSDTRFGEHGEIALARGGAARIDGPPGAQPADGRRSPAAARSASRPPTCWASTGG